MDEKIQNRLLETSTALSLYSATSPSEVEEVFAFRPAVDMEVADSQTLSRFTIILAQYLITLQVRYNTARVISSQKRKVLDRKVAELLRSGAVEGKALKERQANAIALDPELQELELDYDIAALKNVTTPVRNVINGARTVKGKICQLG